MRPVVAAVLVLSPYWFVAMLAVGRWLTVPPAWPEVVRPERELGWCLKAYRERQR